MANQEHRLWVQWAQGREVVSGLRELVGFGKPASTPPWEEMRDAWHKVIGAADDYLLTLSSEMLQVHFQVSQGPYTAWASAQRMFAAATSCSRWL